MSIAAGRIRPIRVNLDVVNITAFKLILLLGVNIVYHRIRVNKGEPGCGKYCSIEVNVAAVNIVYHRISAHQTERGKYCCINIWVVAACEYSIRVNINIAALISSTIYIHEEIFVIYNSAQNH